MFLITVIHASRKDLTVVWSVDTPTHTHRVVFIHGSGCTQFGSRLLFCSCGCTYLCYVFSWTKVWKSISVSVQSSRRVLMYLEAVGTTPLWVAFEMQMWRYKRWICNLFISVKSSATEGSIQYAMMTAVMSFPYMWERSENSEFAISPCALCQVDVFLM